MCLEVRESGLDKFSVGRLPSGQSCDQRLDRRSGGKNKAWSAGVEQTEMLKAWGHMEATDITCDLASLATVN